MSIHLLSARHQPKLQNHGHGASLSHGAPVYCPRLRRYVACGTIHVLRLYLYILIIHLLTADRGRNRQGIVLTSSTSKHDKENWIEESEGDGQDVLVKYGGQQEHRRCRQSSISLAQQLHTSIIIEICNAPVTIIIFYLLNMKIVQKYTKMKKEKKYIHDCKRKN